MSFNKKIKEFCKKFFKVNVNIDEDFLATYIKLWSLANTLNQGWIKGTGLAWTLQYSCYATIENPNVLHEKISVWYDWSPSPGVVCFKDKETCEKALTYFSQHELESLITYLRPVKVGMEQRDITKYDLQIEK